MINFQSLVFWWFLPRVVSYIQSFLYALLYRAGSRKPTPGSQRYVQHNRTIHISVLAIFMLFSIYQAVWDMQREGTLYGALDVSPTADDRAINSRFRRITAVMHPDKIADPSRRAFVETQYVLLKEYRDILSDTAKRYAYDRLGPEVLKLDPKHYRSVWDYVQYGGIQAMQTYLGGLAFMLLAQYVGIAPRRNRFWQCLAFMCVFALNVHVLTHTTVPAFMRHLNAVLAAIKVRPLLPYQFLRVVSTTAVAAFIASQQAASIPPLPSSQRQVGIVDGDQTAHNHKQINEIVTTQTSLNMDGMRLLQMETAPFQGDERQMKELQERMSDWILQNAVRADAKVRNAVGQQIMKRREGAPAGARGTT
ncbi:hypothetical protein EJ05DRAFT_510613 [Pseudovirgaria hyperparasitica]|uniref:J domain-containing protein n=1 Tax=Pseudovirgaria hyperparasitica TaxID=470096 RepID=A0A6A6W9U4_9PEZI|nr:uncharacterized protein EJ05DRAFT_510613 [Pseudovirgaria hyperparasitica]KAF2758720.1 hypothetical protein EJ05DRAFT_510613 [Pseudovirgaria hyperparasitica]